MGLVALTSLTCASFEGCSYVAEVLPICQCFLFFDLLPGRSDGPVFTFVAGTGLGCLGITLTSFLLEKFTDFVAVALAYILLVMG
mgnify:CR=1 FL=1